MESPVFDPFEKIFIERQEQITRMVYVSSHALKSMRGQTRLREVLAKTQNSTASDLEKSAAIEADALKEVNNGFPLLHSAATFLLWSALEASVRDFLIKWLTIFPSARQISEFEKLKVPIAVYENLNGEEKMRYLLDLLENSFGSKNLPGIGRFNSLMKPFGIVPRVDEGCRKDLLEMAAMRNLFAHRAGFADQKLMKLCPWLNLQEGQEVHITANNFYRYNRAACTYAANIIEAAGEIAEKLSQSDGAKTSTA